MIEPELLEFLNSFKDELFQGLDNGLQEVKNEIGGMTSEFKDVRVDFKEMKNELQSLKNQVQGIENKFVGLENKFQGLENKFQGLETQFQGLENEFKIMKNDLKETRSEVQNLKDDMNKRFSLFEERLDSLRQTCARIEHEHGKKLDVFYDYIQCDLEKKEQLANTFFEIDNKLTNHAIRLSVLESSGAFKSILEEREEERAKENGKLKQVN